MFAILICTAIALALAIWLHVNAKDGFSRAFLITLSISGALLVVTAVSLLQRDPKLESSLQAMIQADNATQVLATERPRIEIVISKYPLYRYLAIGLAIAGLLAALFFRNGIVLGIAAGLCLLFVAQISVDQYSETRARAYLADLIRFS